MVEHNDFLAIFEMKKTIMLELQGYTDYVTKTHLKLDINDKKDWRNQIKHCQYCNEIWWKTEGCEEMTTCGQRSRNKDAISEEMKASSSGINFDMNSSDGVFIPSIIRSHFGSSKNTMRLRPRNE